MYKKTYFIFIITIISVSVLSNPLPVGGPGKTIVPYLFKSSNISLEEERIFIKVNEKKEIPSFILTLDTFGRPMHPNKKMTVKCINYDCTYFLKNSKNEKITLSIGFPFYNGRTKAGESYGAIDDFQVCVDSNKINQLIQHSNTMAGNIILKNKLKGAVDFKVIDMLIKKNLVKEIHGQPEMYDFSPMGLVKKDIIKNFNKIKYNKKDKEKLINIIQENLWGVDDAFEAYNNWYYFTVTFNANSITKLHITYNSLNGNYEYISFYYVLKTGKFWNGNIGKCIVNINFGKNDNLNSYKIQPEKYKILDNNIVQFEWENFDPAEDIFIKYLRNNGYNP